MPIQRKVFLLIVLMCSTLLAYEDSDMDGVEDKDDKCPNSSLTQLVDLSGCAIKELVSPHNFDVIVGDNYTKSSDTSANSLTFQMDYYYHNFSLQFLNSYYNVTTNTNTNSNTIYLSSAYQFYLLPNMALGVDGGVAIGDEVDYRLSLNTTYLHNSFLLLGGLSYTLVGDKESLDTDLINYNLGVGYYFSSSFYSIFTTTYLTSTQDIFDAIASFSLSTTYNLDENYFVNLVLSLSNNSPKDKNIIVNIGYYW